MILVSNEKFIGLTEKVKLAAHKLTHRKQHRTHKNASQFSDHVYLCFHQMTKFDWCQNHHYLTFQPLLPKKSFFLSYIRLVREIYNKVWLSSLGYLHWCWDRCLSPVKCGTHIHAIYDTGVSAIFFQQLYGQHSQKYSFFQFCNKYIKCKMDGSQNTLGGHIWEIVSHDIIAESSEGSKQLRCQLTRSKKNIDMPYLNLETDK